MTGLLVVWSVGAGVAVCAGLGRRLRERRRAGRSRDLALVRAMFEELWVSDRRCSVPWLADALGMALPRTRSLVLELLAAGELTMGVSLAGEAMYELADQEDDAE